MFRKKKPYYVLVLMLVAVFGFGQSSKANDSLKALYFSTNNDSVKLNLLRDITYNDIDLGEYDSVKKYVNMGLTLAQKTNNKVACGRFYGRLGDVYASQSKYNEALKHYVKALKMYNKQSDYSGVYNNIGLTYWNKGELTEALRFLLISYEIDKEAKDTVGMSASLLNMGLIYDDQKDYKNAMRYYYSALEMAKVINDQNEISTCYNNIGQAYASLNNNSKAFYFYTQSFDIAKAIGNKRNMALAQNNIGIIYAAKGDFNKAEEYYNEALNLYKILDEASGQTMAMNNLGDLYITLQKPGEAIKIYNEVKEINTINGFVEDQSLTYKGMSKAYADQGNYKMAFECFAQYNRLNDSLLGLNNLSKINDMQKTFEVKEKEKEINLKREADKVIATAEKRKQWFIIISALVIVVLILIFSFFLFKRFKVTQRQNIIIEKQKHLVDEKQKEIVDSINYAKRIQFALLASDGLLKKNLPEHFVLFKPKDVVSGDFYWAAPTSNGFIYATADCTGHGVPGAFMSLLNISKLSQTINENRITRPDLILNNVRTEIIKVLNPGGKKEESKDGMDAILCNLDVKNMRLQYAAANNSFYIVRDNKIIECKADKMPVGKGHDDSILFKNNEIELKKGDTIYTLTDGYADQFGGEKGKKFRYKQLEELLIAINKDTMETQRERLNAAFMNWLGELEQVDDVCIIGVRV